MRQIKLVIVLVFVLILPLSIQAQTSEDVPVRIAVIREFYDGETPTGIYLLEDGEERLISGDHHFTLVEFVRLEWSADCNQMIFTGTPSDQDSGYVQEAILADLETGELTQLTADNGFVRDVFWSPSDDRITLHVVDLETQVNHLMIGSLADMTFETFFSSAENVNLWDWSADGNVLLFEHLGDNGDELYMLDLKSPDFETALLFEGGRVISPRLSADGRQMAFITGESLFERDVFMMDILTREISNMTDNQTGYYSVRWSPDETRLAFTSGDIFTMSSDPAISNPSNITIGTLGFFYQDIQQLYGYTTDSEYLIYTAEILAEYYIVDLFAVSVDATDLVQLTETAPDFEGYNAWYPCMLPS